MDNRGDTYEWVRSDIPEFHQQYPGGTCVFRGIGYSAEIQWKGVHISDDSFVDGYQTRMLVPLRFDKNQARVITGLDMFRDEGLLASYNGHQERVRISGYTCHERMLYEEVAEKIESGTMFLGTFPVRNDFDDLGNDIYFLSPPLKNGEMLPNHLVLFVGHGKVTGYPYLVFVNDRNNPSRLGRIYFNQVYQIPGLRHFSLISVDAGPHPGAPQSAARPPPGRPLREPLQRQPSSGFRGRSPPYGRSQQQRPRGHQQAALTSRQHGGSRRARCTGDYSVAECGIMAEHGYFMRMGTGRKTETLRLAMPKQDQSNTRLYGDQNSSAHNLWEDELAGVIFGCTHPTIKDCLAKQLFGLPSVHFSYVKNIKPGLPVFLFNSLDRKMHGIFEIAASSQVATDQFAWSCDGKTKTQLLQTINKISMKREAIWEKQRFSPAAAELNVILYVVGGYDDDSYLQSVERHNPREGFWTQPSSMRTKRACHFVVVLGETLCSLGGYDGNHMASTLEILVSSANLLISRLFSVTRGYGCAVTVNHNVYLISGVNANAENAVKVHSERQGWSIHQLKHPPKIRMARNFVPGAWGWITSLPPLTHQHHAPLHLRDAIGTIPVPAATDEAMTLSDSQVTSHPAIPTPPSPSPGADLPDTLWTSKPVHLKTKTEQSLDEQDTM